MPGQSYRYCHTHMWLFIRGALVEHNLADYVQICMAVPQVRLQMITFSPFVPRFEEHDSILRLSALEHLYRTPEQDAEEV